MEFLALYRPSRSSDSVPRAATVQRVPGGYVLEAEIRDGRVVALLPADDSQSLAAGELTTTGKIVIRRWAKDGSEVETLTSPASR